MSGDGPFVGHTCTRGAHFAVWRYKADSRRAGHCMMQRLPAKQKGYGFANGRAQPHCQQAQLQAEHSAGTQREYQARQQQYCVRALCHVR